MKGYPTSHQQHNLWLRDKPSGRSPHTSWFQLRQEILPGSGNIAIGPTGRDASGREVAQNVLSTANPSPPPVSRAIPKAAHRLMREYHWIPSYTVVSHL